MNKLIEQSKAYAWLGMLQEANVAASEALSAGYSDDVLVPWMIRLAYKCEDFKVVKALGCDWVRRGKADANLRHYTALALHHLGEPKRAAELMLEIEEDSRESVDSYDIACFLAVAGECDEAVRHLLRSLPGQHHRRAKTWLDGDLKRLWEQLARGVFTLKTAQVLLEDEFHALHLWFPEVSTEWELDVANLADLPEDLRALVHYCPEDEAYVLDPAKAPAGSALAEAFEGWAHVEWAVNQGNFETARRIAGEKVIAAQPRYARDAWKRGDLCAVRHHVLWTLTRAPERCADFPNEIRPMVKEMRAMLKSDPHFFETLGHAYNLSGSEPCEALRFLSGLPREWQRHPFVEHVRGLALETNGEVKEGLACLLRACDSTPDDAGFFIAATSLALRHGWTEAAAAIHRAAPAVAHCYKEWIEADAQLKGEPVPRFRTTTFCGQPDLGGQIIRRKKGRRVRPHTSA